MADPQHQEVLDIWDKIGVILYRLGLSLAALLFWAECLEGFHLIAALNLGTWLLLPAAACGFGLHIYLKSIRLLLQGAGWVALLLSIAAIHLQSSPLALLSLGACYLLLGALCFKESLCFKVPGIRWMPILLAADWVATLMAWSQLHLGLLFLAGLGFSAVSIAKWRMPLHFDIGNKANYQQ